MKLSKMLALLPLATALSCLLIWPLIVASLQSIGYAPIYRIEEFPTLKYFKEVLGSDYFWPSAKLTFYYAFVGTIVSCLIGVLTATLLRRRFQGSKLAEMIIRLPLMVPYLVGVALVTQLFAGGGIFARLVYKLGMIGDASDFPALLYTHSGIGILMVMLWKQAPFIALTLQSVLSSQLVEYEEIAETLGASRTRLFFCVTLPMILPALTAAGLICFAFNFGVFELPFILGGGHPDTLAVSVWRSFNEADYSKRLTGMAGIVIMLMFFGMALWIMSALGRTSKRLLGWN